MFIYAVSISFHSIMMPFQSHSSVSRRTSQNSLFIPERHRLDSHTDPSFGSAINQPSAVLRLSPCVAELTKAIEMILNFKDDANAAASNVPKLSRLIDPQSSNPAHQYNASKILHKLSVRQASRNGLAAHPEVGTLISATPVLVCFKLLLFFFSR